MAISATKRRCPQCKRVIKPGRRGRPAIYCSHSCRQGAYRKRKANRRRPVELLGRDLMIMQKREALRRIIRKLLAESVLADGP